MSGGDYRKLNGKIYIQKITFKKTKENQNLIINRIVAKKIK